MHEETKFYNLIGARVYLAVEFNRGRTGFYTSCADGDFKFKVVTWAEK